jgi:hypothetical protein
MKTLRTNLSVFAVGPDTLEVINEELAKEKREVSYKY